MVRSPFVILGAVLAGILVLAGALFAALSVVDAAGDFASGTSQHGGRDTDVRTAEDALTYTIRDGALGSASDGAEPDAVAEELWGRFSTIMGPDAARIRSFAVYSDPDSSSLASVWRDEKRTAFWHADVNAAFIDDRDELVHTLVHEFGHILTLSDDQVPVLSGACPTFEMVEGCPGADTAVAEFQKRFWAPYGESVPANEGEDDDEVESFFLDHGSYDTFVTRYAATNPVEDLAESWAEYVLSDQPGVSLRDPSGQEESSQKVAFFAEFPALAAQRDRIRTALDLG